MKTTSTPVAPLALAKFRRLKTLTPAKYCPFSTRQRKLTLTRKTTILVLRSTSSLHRQPKIRPCNHVLKTKFDTSTRRIATPSPRRENDHLTVRRYLRHDNLLPARISCVRTRNANAHLGSTRRSNLVAAVFPRHPPIDSAGNTAKRALKTSKTVKTTFYLLTLHARRLPPGIKLANATVCPGLIRPTHSTTIGAALYLDFNFNKRGTILTLKRTSN